MERSKLKLLLVIFAFIAVGSIVLNISYLQQIEKLKEKNDVYVGSAIYTIVLRLDRQCDICDLYGIYFKEMAKGQMSKEEFSKYAFGTELITRQDMLSCFYHLQFGDNSEITDAINKASYSTYIPEKTLNNLSTDDMAKLSELYSQLSELFNRNNKHSLNYYVDIDDSSNPEAISASRKIYALSHDILSILEDS